MKKSKINESIYKLERKLTTCTATLKLEPETHIPDLMTRIRILPAIAVVAQSKKVARFFDGDDIFERLKIVLKIDLKGGKDIKSRLQKVTKNQTKCKQM